MKNFCSYFQDSLFESSKFRDIGQTLIKKVKDIVSTYELVYKKLSKTDMKLLTQKVDEEGGEWSEFFTGENVDRVAKIGAIKFKDLANNKIRDVEVIVAYGPHEASFANYDEDNDIITLFQNQIKNITNTELEAIIIHEITHGFQEYKTTSEPYKKTLKRMAKGLPYNKKVYFSEPVEFDAHLTELAHRIKADYYSLKNAIKDAVFPETANVYKRRIEKFLLELKNFIKSDANAYLKYEELPLPAFFSTHDEFLDTISNFPDLWKKTKEKLANLYLKLN